MEGRMGKREAYVAAANESAKARAYVFAYRGRPERAGEQRTALATALEALASEPWCE